ncbi:MAG: glycoside hydrolase family 9 protein [Ruminococcus sp.]|nr:glycoside hydrolase family 9 protein [Ruminococcus sp.]
MLKKFTSGLLSAVMLAASTAFSMPMSSTVSAASDQNYADALDKSLFFYEAQQAGPLPEWNRVEWKTDSTMSDGVLGGWYDAGDHVKFNLPMAYSASLLAWGMYQYPDGLEKTGLAKTYQNNLEFVLDYLADCDKGTEAVFQVGNGTIDHTWWGPIGLLQYGMEDSGTSYESARAVLKASKGCSAVFGEMAAALAAGAAALDGKIDASKKASYIEHAENLFKMADASKSDDVYNDSDASGFYRSSHFYDELFYAANWLYIATGDNSYLDKAESYIPNLGKMLGEGDKLAYGWGHCWDDTMQGGMLLYAINTGEYKDHVKKHLDRWVNGTEAKKLDGGLRWLTTWGCLRYANTAAFLASVASDTIFKDEDTSAYVTFAEEQVNYSLGDNPRNSSYVVGYGENSPKNPHHRTAHGSWKNDLAVPANNRHILYGALVGGPNEDGSYEDDRQNYINNEVATDYNAGFTAMLCKMVEKYGGTTDPNFPPKEEHDGPEFFVECTSKGAESSGMTISFKVTNHSAWPARAQDNVSFRYYMDLSEVKAAGANPEDVVIRCDRDQSAMYASSGVKPAEISKVQHYDGDIYYVEVNLPDGRACLPISEGMQQCEILLALVMPNYGSGWDATNDFSNKDILTAKTTTGADGTVHGIVTPYVPVYVNGKLYYGEEPDGTKADGLGGTGAPKPVVTEADPPKTTTTTTTTKSDEPLSPPKSTESTTKETTTTSTSTTVITSSEDVKTVTTVSDGNKNSVSVTKYGDANCDNDVTLSDAVLIMQSIANPGKYGVKGTDTNKITEQGSANADCSNVGDGVTNKDALAIQKFMLKIIDKLPE